jgi:hypothetical protein
MSYILVEIDSCGYIRAQDYYQYESYGCQTPTTIVHRESVDIDKTGAMKVYSDLDSAKADWDGSGDSDKCILALDEQGAGKDIWMGEEQAQRLTERLKIWSSCYGGWKVRKLNS